MHERRQPIAVRAFRAAILGSRELYPANRLAREDRFV